MMGREEKELEELELEEQEQQVEKTGREDGENRQTTKSEEPDGQNRLKGVTPYAKRRCWNSWRKRLRWSDHM